VKGRALRDSRAGACNAIADLADGMAKWTSGKRSSRKSSMSPEASAYFEKNDCRILIEPTPEAIRLFNQSRAKKIGLMHVTC
jgi:hypothetical protein